MQRDCGYLMSKGWKYLRMIWSLLKMERSFTHQLVFFIFIFIFSHAKTVSNKIKKLLKLGEDFDRNSSLLEYEILEKLG